MLPFFRPENLQELISTFPRKVFSREKKHPNVDIKINMCQEIITNVDIKINMCLEIITWVISFKQLH